MFISVDLPAPFSPRSAWISPRRNSKSIPSTASTLPKCLTMPVIRTAGMSSAGAVPGPPNPAPVSDIGRECRWRDLRGLWRAQDRQVEPGEEAVDAFLGLRHQLQLVDERAATLLKDDLATHD